MRGIEERLKRKRGKQDQAGIAVRLEYRQTDVRVVDLESGDLPTEMRREQGKPNRSNGTAAGTPDGERKQDHSTSIKEKEQRLGTGTEQQRRRSDADQRISPSRANVAGQPINAPQENASPSTICGQYVMRFIKG